MAAQTRIVKTKPTVRREPKPQDLRSPSGRVLPF